MLRVSMRWPRPHLTHEVGRRPSDQCLRVVAKVVFSLQYDTVPTRATDMKRDNVPPSHRNEVPR